jgi:predicted acetyltransferase
VRIAVSDPLGLTDGVYSLAVRGGTATVTADKAHGAPSDVSMDMAALGSLYLGGVRADTLARTGQVTAQSRDAIDVLDALLAHREQPYCITHF